MFRQLYELINGQLIDSEIIKNLKKEYDTRDISILEEQCLKQKFDLNHATFNKEIGYKICKNYRK